MGIIKGDQEVEGTLFAADIQFYIGKHGDILYKDRGKWKKLHIGNPLEVLTVDPATLFPYWAPVVGAGGIRLEQGFYVGTGIAIVQAIVLATLADPLHADIVSRDEPDTVINMDRQVKKKTMQALGTTTWTYHDTGVDSVPPATIDSVDTITLAANLMSITGTANVLGRVYHYSVFG